MPSRQDFKKAQGVVGHPKFADALADIEENTGDAEHAKRNPKDYFRGKGIEIPPDVNIQVIEGTWSVQLDLGIIKITYTW